MTESTVESAALAWLEAVGWGVAHGPDCALEVLANEWRNAWLPKLISGEIRVKDAVRIVGEA